MKHGLAIRGDSLYCPLPIAIEVYWNCLTDCHHCFLRAMNHVWGKELRPISLEALEKKLRNGLINENPKSILAHCLRNKKTIKIGNKADAFQDIEREYLLSTGTMKILRKLDWSYVVQTRFTSNLREVADEQVLRSNKKGLINVLPVMSPGLEKDWELFERKRTTPIHERVKDIKYWLKKGVALGVNGEPFISGFHTLKDFENTVKLLKSIGVKRYNIYNFHFNPHVAKKIYNLPGVDIEKIWELNQDKHWIHVQRKLMEIAVKHDIKLGCPDFVNTGWEWREQSNTCCGIDVPNPCTFNTHYFKKYKQEGLSEEDIIKKCYDGSGDFQKGKDIVYGNKSEFFTLKDIK